MPADPMPAISTVPPLPQQPPRPIGRGRLFVLQTGLVTTALTLVAVYLLSRWDEDVNVMGWYFWWIVPAGALLVGLAAGSGYGLASRWMGVKIGHRLVLTILALPIGAYAAAQYIEFRSMHLVYEDTLEPVGFWYYFHAATMAWSWQERGGVAGEPFGMWGYLFRLLEVTGFVAGGLVAPLLAMAQPYCDACQRYKKTKELGLLPASVAPRESDEKDDDARATYAAEQRVALDAGTALYDRLGELAAAGDIAGFRTAFETFQDDEDQRAIAALPIRIKLQLAYCPTCYHATLEGSLVAGHGENAKVELLPTAPVAPAVAAELTRPTTSATTTIHSTTT